MEQVKIPQRNTMRKYTAIQNDYNSACRYDEHINRSVRADIVKRIADKYFMSVATIRKVLRCKLDNMQEKQKSNPNQLEIFN